MKPSELPGARSLYRLTNHALAQIRELWQYAAEDELPPDSLLQAQVEAFRILRIDVPLSAMQHYLLLQRNLVYTAMTRGRRLVVLVGQRKALTIAFATIVPQKDIQAYTIDLSQAKLIIAGGPIITVITQGHK